VGDPFPPFADVDSAFLIAPDGRHVFALVDASLDGSLELWSLPIFPARGTEPIRLSGKAVPGGGLAPGLALTDEYDGVPQPQFALGPDGTRIVYRADQDIDGVYEIYAVPSDGSAPAVKLNAPLEPGKSVPPFGFRLDPAGVVVVYAAPDGAGVMRLHAAPSDASAPPIELGGPFVAGGSLWLSSSDGAASCFQITRDGATVVYAADQRTDETIELFAVPLDGSSPAHVLNGALVPGGDVRSFDPRRAPFALSPDGKRVAYLADQRTDEVFELFLSTIEPSARVRPAQEPR
jgi:Tol biopolymer transport system component